VKLTGNKNTVFFKLIQFNVNNCTVHQHDDLTSSTLTWFVGFQISHDIFRCLRAIPTEIPLSTTPCQHKRPHCVCGCTHLNVQDFPACVWTSGVAGRHNTLSSTPTYYIGKTLILLSVLFEKYWHNNIYIPSKYTLFTIRIVLVVY